MNKCVRCGNKMLLEGSFDFNDYGNIGEGIINNYFCENKKCECTMLFFIPDVDYDAEGE